MPILTNTERLGVLTQAGGWESMARKRHQKGSLRLRGTVEPHWEVQFWADYLTPDGKLARKQVTFPLGAASEISKKQAKARAEETLRPYNSGMVSPFATILFSEFVDRQYTPLSLRVLKASTRNRYCSTLKVHLLPAFGNSRLCDIHTVDIQRFVLQKFESGLGWEMCNHLRNLLSKIFQEAKRFGHFKGENPASLIRLPERVAVRNLDALSNEQVGALLKQLDEPVRTMVLIAVLTGLRVGELLGLRWQHVNLDDGSLKVTETVYRGAESTPKTKRSRRCLPLPSQACTALRKHRSRCGTTLTEDRIFQTCKGTPYSDTNLLARHLKPAGEAIGVLWIGWHTLRRTHATLLYNSGATVKDAQAQLGHADASTTLRTYVQPLPEHQRESVEKMAQLVANGGGSTPISVRVPNSNLLQFPLTMQNQ